MPLTGLQEEVLKLLSENRAPDSYLAGGGALHAAPNSSRYSQDLDFFHDSEHRVAEAFAADRSLLEAHGYRVEVEYALPGNVRAMVSHGDDRTRVDWAHDSAWRFMPVVRDETGGYRLHEVDLAINKLLALAGRDEVRDYVDVLENHERILPLGAQIWAAAGKDPGLSPHAILELLKRRGRPRQSELDRLHLARPLDAERAKDRWLRALEHGERFVSSRPAGELGCLYFHPETGAFRAPEEGHSLEDQGLVPHFGRPGGVIPLVGEADGE
ncbi:MAG: hypothetical protein EA351_01525 [Gemmatimonadales bacterium]|nr:MAG: hypothetical protein EA351_01525 [Gemmatimonadales bacterium]